MVCFGLITVSSLQKRAEFFVGIHNKRLSVVAMSANAPPRSPSRQNYGRGNGVGRGEDGVGTGVRLGGGVGRGHGVARGDGGVGTGVM